MRRAISLPAPGGPLPKHVAHLAHRDPLCWHVPSAAIRLRGSRSAHRHLASGGATALFSPGVARVDVVINDARTAAIVFSQGADDLDFELWPAVNSVYVF